MKASALARSAASRVSGYRLLPTRSDVPDIFDTRDRGGLAMSAVTLSWVAEQVIEHLPDQRHGHRLADDLGSVEHVNSDQVVGIGHAHTRQCPTEITVGDPATPANTLAV